MFLFELEGKLQLAWRGFCLAQLREAAVHIRVSELLLFCYVWHFCPRSTLLPDGDWRVPEVTVNLMCTFVWIF